MLAAVLNGRSLGNTLPGNFEERHAKGFERAFVLARTEHSEASLKEQTHVQQDDVPELLHDPYHRRVDQVLNEGFIEVEMP